MYLFVVNPHSGNRNGLTIWREIETQLKQDAVEHKVILETERKKMNDGLLQFLSSKQKIVSVVIIGGDGTIHEVLNQIIPYDLPFGVIPAGSGNDFAKSYRLSLQDMIRIQHGVLNMKKLIRY